MGILSLLAIICSILVVTAPNTILSIVWLVTVFILISLVLGYIGLTYAALTYIIVYVGAIAILFLFVVQLLDQRSSNTFNGSNQPYTSSFFFEDVKKKRYISNHMIGDRDSLLSTPKSSMLFPSAYTPKISSSNISLSNTGLNIININNEKVLNTATLHTPNNSIKNTYQTPLISSQPFYSINKGVPFSILLGILFIGILGFSDMIPLNITFDSYSIAFSSLMKWVELSNAGFNSKVESYTLGTPSINVNSWWTSLGLEPLPLRFNNYSFIGQGSNLTNLSAYSSENLLTYKGQVQSLGQWLYGVGTIALIITSVILLLAMVGPIILCWSYL